MYNQNSVIDTFSKVISIKIYPKLSVIDLIDTCSTKSTEVDEVDELVHNCKALKENREPSKQNHK